MGRPSDNGDKELDQRLREMERKLRSLPDRIASTSSIVYSVQIYDGNTLSSGQTGIKRKSSTLNEAFASSEAAMVAAAYGTTLPDGVGRGYLYADGVQLFNGSTPLLVLVGLDTRAGVFFALAKGEWVKASATRIKIGSNAGVDIYGYRPEFR